MADIPPLALERLAKLRRLYNLSRAAADDLHPAVEDARRTLERAMLGLEMATRADRAAVIVGERDGLSYVRAVRERTAPGDGPGAAYALDVTSTLVREPKFDGHTRPIFEARAALAEATSRRREVLDQASDLRRAVEAVEQELRKRGWREHALDTVFDPTAATPTVANPAARQAGPLETALRPVARHMTGARR